MELNRRMQHVVEALPSGPASPIWDLDGADSPIPTESYTMSTISGLGSSEATIGCSSPGLTNTLLPDPCLGSIVDLSEGLHEEGNIFDASQVNCTFSSAADSSVTTLDSISNCLDPCEDSSDTLKHDNYGFPDCNTDHILPCGKNRQTEKTFPKPSPLNVSDCVSMESCLHGLNNLVSGSSTISCPAILNSNTTSSSFSLPVLLSSSPSLSSSSPVSGALTVININLPVLSSATSHTNSSSNVRINQQQMSLSNLVLVPGAPTGTLAIQSPALQNIPAIPLSNLSSIVTPSKPCRSLVQNGFPILINPMTSLSSENNNTVTVCQSSNPTIQNTFSSNTAAIDVIDTQSAEIDANKFLNIDTECDLGKKRELNYSEKDPPTEVEASGGQTRMTLKTGTNDEDISDLAEKADIISDPTEDMIEALPISSISDSTDKSSLTIVRLFPTKKAPHIFKCDLCSATFNKLGNYSRHKKIHTVHVKDDFRHKCNECGRTFLQKCDLKRHELIHEKKEPYRCSICSKGYIRQSDLRVHMRFHTREKAFKCEYCPKSYYQSGDLNRHVRVAHLRSKMLTCGHCDQPYGYVKESTLIRHMQTKHKDIIQQSLNQKLANASETNMPSNPPNLNNQHNPMALNEGADKDSCDNGNTVIKYPEKINQDASKTTIE